MDYTEMLFAYQVRQEAMRMISQKYPDGMTDVEMLNELDSAVADIVKSTAGVANRVRRVAATIERK